MSVSKQIVTSSQDAWAQHYQKKIEKVWKGVYYYTYIYIYSLLFLCFSLSLVHKQTWSTRMITLFARKTSSFAMHKEVPRVWRGWFLRCQLKIWVHSSIPLRVAWGLVGAANVGSSCEEHVVMLAVLSHFHVPSFAHIFTRWHGTWWCSIFCRVKMMSHVHAPSPIFVVFDLGFPFNMTILLCAPKWMMKLFRLTEFYYQTAARLSHLMKWFMGHPGIHLRNIFQAELAHIRLKHRKCNGWMFVLFLYKRLMQCQLESYSALHRMNHHQSDQSPTCTSRSPLQDGHCSRSATWMMHVDACWCHDRSPGLVTSSIFWQVSCWRQDVKNCKEGERGLKWELVEIGKAPFS